MVYKHNAILLIGPTGTGKTPLGECLVQNGLAGKRCFHFDFGENLRNADENPDLPEEDREFIRQMLQTGALLEMDRFYIAETILDSFIRRNEIGPDDIIVMNGLPRHVEQARSLEKIIRINKVIYLSCSPETVWERIRNNTGGDRTGRDDDDFRKVENKIKIFKDRTEPLVQFFKDSGVPVKIIEVSAKMTALMAVKEIF